VATRLSLVFPLAISLTGCAGAAAQEPASGTPGSGNAVAPAEPAAQPTAVASSAPEAPAQAAAPAAVPPLPKGTVVLHVGDSFVHSGLTQRLREHLKPLGVRYEVRAEHSTNSLDWAKRMPEIVASTQPDLVIVTLGGNEIGSKHLDVQGRAVERIVKTIGDRPCVWTTPPLWMEESGVFDAIQEHLAPCRFFETDVEVGKFIPRRDDKIHPTMEGGAMWADKLFAYLERERTTGQKPWSLRDAPSAERTPKGRRGPLAQ
jgi:hypothetical protein